MAYLLDANVFIQARNLHYGMDFCPAFWDWLDTAHAAGRVLSLEQVRNELTDQDLSAWARARDTMFAPPEASVVPSLGLVSQWAATAGYEPTAVHTFLQVADYFLVATAHAQGLAVVTHEVAANTTKKVKIPNACLALGIHFTTTFAMLRAEGARFVLEGP